MSLIRYHLKVEDYFLQEYDYFPATSTTEEAAAMIQKIVVNPLQKRREELGEPPITLHQIDILNPHVHAHDWKKVRDNTYALKTEYRCSRCGITGHRRLNLFKGESKAEVERSEPWTNKKYQLCRDKLAAVPKKLSFK